VPARVRRPFGSIWPVPAYGTLNAVLVEYEAGYAPSGQPDRLTADSVPSAIKAAMKLMIGHWYENRESVAMNVAPPQEVPLAVKQLLAPTRSATSAWNEEVLDGARALAGRHGRLHRRRPEPHAGQVEACRDR
jgi:hypothetical protein